MDTEDIIGMKIMKEVGVGLDISRDIVNSTIKVDKIL